MKYLVASSGWPGPNNSPANAGVSMPAPDPVVPCSISTGSPARIADGRVVQLQLGHHLAGVEPEVARDPVALPSAPGSRPHALPSSTGRRSSTSTHRLTARQATMVVSDIVMRHASPERGRLNRVLHECTPASSGTCDGLIDHRCHTAGSHRTGRSFTHADVNQTDPAGPRPGQGAAASARRPSSSTGTCARRAASMPPIRAAARLACSCRAARWCVAATCWWPKTAR